MIKALRGKFKSIRNGVGLVVGLLALGGIVDAISDIGDVKRHGETQDVLIQDLKNQVHAYEIALGEMKHACNLANMQYSYCKKSVKSAPQITK